MNEVCIPESWEEAWGESHYSLPFKVELFKPGAMLSDLEAQGGFGDRIIEVGGGKQWPLSNSLRNARRRVINVDIASDETPDSQYHLPLHFDIESLAEIQRTTTRAALIKAARFLDLDPRTCEMAQADTFIFSEVLNYVDFKSVLTSCAAYLKPGGRFVVINQPDRGYSRLFLV